MRVALKIAIIRSLKTQRQLSLEVGIPETRLSELVRGRGIPTEAERDTLADVLACHVDELFPAASTLTGRQSTQSKGARS
jgi:transcriptional regulator with XRE-family HTH domain